MGIMLNFARLVTIRILPFFLVSIVSILLITHSSPPPSIVTSGEPGFSACRLPCWAGLLPQKTAFRDALKIITTNLPGWNLDVQANNAQMTFTGSHGEKRIGGIIYEDRSLVGRIRLDVAFPLWYLIEEFGRPYCVRVNYLSSLDADVVVIYWRLADMFVMAIIILEQSEKWYPGTRIETLLTISSNECTLLDARPWEGFARLWRYQTDYLD
jgi:hypothetical protein